MQKELILSNKLSELDTLLDATEDFLASCDVPLALQFKIKLALDELFSNIVSYGYEPNVTDQVVVTLDVDNNVFSAILNDGGKPFNPLDVTDADTSLSAEDRPIGGLGIHLVRKISRDMTYHRTQDRNVLQFFVDLA